MAVTVVVWAFALFVERWLGIPRIEMGSMFRLVFLILFAADFSAMIVWSLMAKTPSRGGGELKIQGPYRWVRYPLYSAIIFSGTGMVAFWYRSWVVIFSVIVINFFWTWHVRKEESHMVERLGEEYVRSTGQFFPRFRHSDSSGEDR